MIQAESERQAKSGKKPRVPRRYEGVVAVVALLVAWEMAAAHLPPILFPSLLTVGSRFMQLLQQGNLLTIGLQTYARILGAVLISFAICSALGILAGLAGRVDRFLSPLIQIKQGVPSLCWIIFSILWFRDVEVRNVFIVLISTMPSLYFLARDGVRAIPADLWQMVQALRPNRRQIVARLLLPAVLPNLLTGLRVNIGTGARVVVFAELLGGVSGVGYQLRLAEEQFMMSDVMAWTLVLVAWVLVCDLLLKWVEARVLRERGVRGSDE